MKQEESANREIRRLLLKSFLALLLGIPLFVVSMLDKTFVSEGLNQVLWIAVGILVFLLMWYSGGHFFSGAWTSFKAHNANMSTLVALATGPAWIYSFTVSLWPTLFPRLARHIYYDAPMTVIGLLLLGAALELLAGAKATKTVKKFSQFQPERAKVKENGAIKEVSLNEIKKGDVLAIHPGERVPVDGEVIEGESTFVEIELEKEGTSQKKMIGDKIFAGALNRDNPVVIKAITTAQESSLVKIIELIKQAQSSKPTIGNIADKISAIFAPLVILIAMITLGIWMNFGPFPKIAYMLVTFMAVLLIACPCAVGLAAPISITTGVGKAAENGILFHQGDAFTDLNKMQVLVIHCELSNFDAIRPTLNKSKIHVVESRSLNREELIEKMTELHKKNKRFALVSDETVDKELLQHASISIIMGKQAYLVESDISILTKSAFKLLDALKISKATLSNIKQNLTGAFVYNAVAIPLAAGILYPLTKMLFHPILAGALMASSSLAVILNANRLHLLRLKT